MLFGINPLITSELLHVLSSMGHGDELVIVDRNFPAYSVAETTYYGNVVELAGAEIPEAIKAILSLMPLDSFDKATFRMDPETNELPAVQLIVKDHLEKIQGAPWQLDSISRYDFYERAKDSFAIIRTSERRPYGCFLFKKGVLDPYGKLMTPESASQSWKE